jgi:hypothetical protein
LWWWKLFGVIVLEYVLFGLLDELLQFLIFLVGFVIDHALKCCFAVGQCLHDFVGWCDGWVGDIFVLKLDCVG